MNPRPPELLTRMLSRAVGADARDEIIGDLHEEYAEIAALRGVRRARLWYAAEAIRLAAGAMPGRLGRRRPADRNLHRKPSGDPFMRSLLPDIRQATRALLKRPALTFLVVATLALGLGANATIFQVIDALVLRPFTIRDVDRLVVVAAAPPGEAYVQESVSPADYIDWKREATVFETFAALQWWDVNFAGGNEAERIQGHFVSADFFRTIGAEPALGRAFTAEEEIHGKHRRVVLSHDLWERRFAGDPAVLGTTILLDAEQFEIIGIAPAGFSFPVGTQVWAPLAFDAKTAARRDGRYLTVIGRLAAGRSIDDAQAEMSVVGQRLEQQYPDTNKDRAVRVVSLTEGMRDEGLGPIVVLWQAAAGLVLLIACANIANLLLARGTERQREVAVRSALGASRRRIVRELLVESLLLAMLAVPAALAVAWIGITVIRGNLPARLVRFVAGWQSMDVDGRLVLFTTVLAVITAVVFGLLPAVRASRPVLSETLKEGGRTGTAGRSRQRLRSALVVAELGLALPLLVASTLAVMGANRFLNGPQGYEGNGLLIMRAILPDAKYAEHENRRRFVEEVERRLSALPGVRSVAIANVLPATSSNAGQAIEIEGVPVADRANPPRVDYRAITPAFFETLRIPVMQGRGVVSSDTSTAQRIAVISRSLADRYFRGEEPIGRRIKLGNGPWLTIVGITGDVIHGWYDRRNAPTAYVPYAQSPTAYLGMAVRADGDLDALIPAVRSAVRSVDAAQPLFDMMPMPQLLHERTIGLQYVAAIMAVFGGLALLLAVVGVYSVMAFVITQRTPEIGVRIALGASRADVLRLTIGQSASITAVGIAVGLGLSYALGRVMEAALFGTVTADAWVSLTLAAVLVAAAVLAGYVPARRATSIDPMIALRN